MVLKGEHYLSCGKLLVYWREMTLSWKISAIVCRGKKNVSKPLFSFIEKQLFPKKTVLFVFVLKIDDLVIKLFYVVFLTVLDIHLSDVASILFLFRNFMIVWNCTVFWMGSKYIFIEEKMTTFRKLSLFYIFEEKQLCHEN